MYRARSDRNRNACIKLFEEMAGIPFYIIDTETTGLDPLRDHIIEFAAIKCQISDGTAKEVERIDIFIRPPFDMDEKVVAIHGITNESLKDQPEENEVIGLIQRFIGERPILIGHNVEFDIKMLLGMFWRCRIPLSPAAGLDTLEFARDLLTQKEVDDYKLGTLVKLFGLDAGLKFHRAIDDVVATMRLLNCLYMEYKKRPGKGTVEKIHVNYMWFWSGFNKNQIGIYLDTSVGRIYYSTVNKCWMSSTVNLGEVDIDEMERYILYQTGITNMREFGRLTEKKFEEMKKRRKAQGYRI
uniref:3'-5' exonuclease n=1 Tax=Lachnoclostridium phocaeense TaxID=1871021 RepID=UPI0026DBF3CA|nr:3'-5' exonuclease [Lachnoclostridium phocaeense]